MAIVNLGSIKFNWKGAYAGGTAYAVDDVVSYNGSSYVCTAASTGNLPTDTNFWDQMSSAGTNGTNGTNGTDVGTVITTQGDILYRDGSGLQRLAAGTSGNALVTKGSGQNPVWESVGADFSPIFRAYMNANQGFSSNTTTRVNYSHESYDPDSVFNTSTQTFTVPSGKGGKYFVYSQVRKDSFSGNRGEMAIKVVNGAELMVGELGSVGDSYSTIFTSGVVELTAGQELEVIFFHSDSGTRNLNGHTKSAFFGAYRLTA